MVAKPNIVLVIVDDMAAGMVDDLPRLRTLLSDRGLSFSAAYTPAPSCCPARAAILRGQYPHNTGVLANGPPQGGHGAFRHNGNEASTIATWLHDAGYRTALVGKYLNDYEKSLKHVPAGWHRWFVYGGKGKFNQYRVSDQGKVRQYGEKGQKKHYQTDVLARKAVDFIRTTPAAQPFFLYLAPSAPHEPATPAKRHRKAAVARLQAPRVPSYNESDVNDKPSPWRGLRLLNGKQVRKADAVYVKQLKCMLAVEDMVARVIDALAGTNRLENTYIVFTADNGYHHGQHRITPGKGTPFEEAIRAPLIVVGPGVPAGATSDALISLIDLGPTFAEWAGASVPDFVDGRSLAPLLDGGTPSGWRDAVSSELLHFWAGGFVVLRSGEYAYTAYGNGERELYDIRNDPFQIDNLALTAPPAILQQLESRLDALVACGIEGAQMCQDVDGGP